MKRIKFVLMLVVIFLVSACEKEQMVSTTISDLENKIKGGWVGKAYGVSFGGPTEFGTQGAMIEGPLEMKEEGLKWLNWQDDMYVNMALLKAVDENGLNATAADFAQEFAYGGFMLWHANGQGRQNILAGIPPELSGHPKYNPHANDIDFQIEADFIGLLSPGLPVAAEAMCDKAGHLMNWGDGVYGGVFVSAMYAAAFIEKDINRVVELGQQAMPQASLYAQTIADVIDWYQETPDDWTVCWQKVEDKYNDDRCPWGAKNPFNIAASINGAYIAMGLLYGQGDYEKTINISTRCGQDSDCNPANAGGVLGTMLGYEGLPETVKTTMAPHVDVVYEFTPYSITTGTETCLRLALENIVAAGGSVNGQDVHIKVQDFANTKPAEISFPSLAIHDKYDLDDERLTWTGSWVSENEDGKGDLLYSDEAGASLAFPFEGNAIYVQGNIRHDHGILEIYLDDELVESRDMYNPAKWERSDQCTAVWLTGLADGPHTLLVRVTGEKREQADGTLISLGRIVSYVGEIATL